MTESRRSVCRWAGLITVVSLLTLTAGCNSDKSASEVAGTPAGGAAATSPPRTPSGPPTATIRNNKVSPSTLRVETGATVVIRNNDDVGHRLDNRANHLYSGTIPAHRKGELTLPPDRGTYVFTDPHSPSVTLTVKVR